MDFQEAETRFQQIERRHATGQLSEPNYRAALSELRVTDEWGRLWMLQEQTGQWHIYYQEQWVPSTPPRPAAPQPPLTPSPSVAQPPRRERSTGSKVLLYFIIWAVFWIVIGGAVLAFGGTDGPKILAGVGVAALLSLVLMLGSLVSSWSGQVVDIRTERVRVDDDDGPGYWKNRMVAYIRQPNGRTRKMAAMGDWQVGDRLEKRRGEAYIRKL
ncbi:MAG TPA: hypothetical protein VII92_09430 [Anaerolineae bacterium]